ncbi:MAG: hypothetical protein ABIQ75_05210 [Flavobacteriales bacterium]
MLHGAKVGEDRKKQECFWTGLQDEQDFDACNYDPVNPEILSEEERMRRGQA